MDISIAHHNVHCWISIARDKDIIPLRDFLQHNTGFFETTQGAAVEANMDV